MGGSHPQPSQIWGEGKRREERLDWQPGSCFSSLYLQKRPLTLGVNPSAVLGTCFADGASASPRRARDLRARLDILLVPKINVPFASWTELLIVLEDNSQISAVFTALKAAGVPCGLSIEKICLEGTRIGDQEGSRWSSGLLSYGSAGVCGPEMRLLVNINSEIVLKISVTAHSLLVLNGLPKIITPATMLIEASEELEASCEAIGTNGRLLLPLLSSPFLLPPTESSRSQIKPCQHQRWRTQSALTTDGTNVMDASQALSCCAT